MLDLRRVGSFSDLQLSIRCYVIEIVISYSRQPEQLPVNANREGLKSWLCNSWQKWLNPHEHNGLYLQAPYRFFPPIVAGTNN